jgi:hypothetical protein
MRRFWQLLLVLHLALASVMAAPRPDDNAITEKAAPENAAGAAETVRASTAGPDAELSALEVEMRELRELLAAQAHQLQAQSEQLKQQQQAMELLAERVRAVGAGRDTSAPAPGTALVVSPTANLASATGPLAVAADAAAPRVPQAAQSQDEIGQRIEERLARIGPFSFSGDFRLRDEPFFGGSSNQAQVRHRGRIRAHFNINARLNDEIGGGFSLASGHLDDAISTNQDLDQFFSRKPFDLDRAFLTYTPRWFRQWSFTGGKFAIPWYRTELTWDNDVNVEGVAQTLNFALPTTPVLKRLAIVGFALPFAQTTGVNFNFRPGDNNRSVRQSVVYGGQLQTEWQLAVWLKLSAYSAFFDWHNADPIALSTVVANAASPNRGTLRLAGFSLQNSITVWTQSTTVPASAGGTANVNTSILNAQFASKFGLLDTIARFDIQTPSAKWPVVLLADFVQNTEACSNVGNFLAPTPAAGATVTATTNVACNPRDRQAYWLEGRFGRAAEPGDWQFAYTRMFIEREAVLGAYDFSDLRQSSSVSQHRVEAFYNFYRNLQVGFTGLFGRPLKTSAPAETILKRLQFDVLYRF